MCWIDAESAAAVAAAAYAIYILEEPKPRIWNEKTYPDKSMNKMKSKAKDTGILPEPRKIAPKFSDKTSKQSFKDSDTKMPEKALGSAPSVKKKINVAEINETNSDEPDNQELERARERGLSTGRPLTFADKRSDTNESKRPETPAPKPDSTPTGWSMNPPTDTRTQSVRKPGPRDYIADAWTKEEMTSIKERYERLRDTIDNWEAKKKMKAKLKMERTEAKLEKKRAEAVGSGEMERMKAELEKKKAKAAKRYRSDIARIEEIAAGARAQAEDNRRNEEFKVKEKANRIRLTGELPKKSCLCF